VSADQDFLLHLADNALVLGQRNAEWCGHGPILEEDIAMANISLDLIGQARMLYQHAASLQGDGVTEDSLAYFRDPDEFRNFTLLELPHSTACLPSAAVERDYAVTICRNFLYSCLMLRLWDALQFHPDAQLQAIAANSIKEVRYHLRHSSDWMLRLGDGTAESAARMQAALDHLMPYTQEFWTPFGPSSSAIDLIMQTLHPAWQAGVAAVVAEAGLKLPLAQGHVTRGKFGLHSEHLSYLLMQMQSLARAHPGAVW